MSCILCLDLLYAPSHILHLIIFPSNFLFKGHYFSIFTVYHTYHFIYSSSLTPHSISASLFFLLKLLYPCLQFHSSLMEPYIFLLIELQGLSGYECLLPKWRYVDDQCLILLSEQCELLLASATAGAGVRLVHILQVDSLQLLYYLSIDHMKMLARVLVFAFFLQYYLTLAISIGLNLLKKGLGWLRGGKDVPKIHPFHNAHEEVFSWKEDFIRLEGYSLEEHRFGTRDGAEVHLWRIRRESPPPDKPYPVVIMHGLLESAATWFLAGEKCNCLPYLLAAEGYDVWVGNNRGNRLSQTPGKYHNYNIDDLVLFDQPAIIQGVLQKTDKKKIIYVGHSQGSTQFLLVLGVHEELKEKVALFVGMGSIVCMKSLVNIPLNYISRVYFFELLQLLGFEKVLLFSRWMSQSIGVLLYNSSFHLMLIMRGIKHLVGMNNDLIPASMVGLIFTHEPGGSSVNNLLHWIQCFRSRKTFSKFCYGKTRNLEVYGTEQPPEYALQHLKTLPFPSLLFRGEKDGLASHEDFMQLVSCFDQKSVVSVELKEYNHLDYLWGERAPIDIYQRVLSFANVNTVTDQAAQSY